MEDVTFERFGPSELAEWLARTNADYVEERVAAGDTPDEAKTNAEASMRRAFPEGSPAPGQLAGRILRGGQPIGELWVGPAGSDPEQWWVWNVRIDEPLRGRGFGRAPMLVAEELARTSGAVSIGLNVFARNGVARNRYTSLGYRETSVRMRKDLVPTRAESAAPRTP